MVIYGCGNNTSKQLYNASPQILCCPTPINVVGEAIEAHIAFSHILWKTELSWKLTGYKGTNLSLDASIHPQWKVSVSENRTAAIKGSGSVVLWDKENLWRALCFQNYDENRLENNDSSSERPIADEQELVNKNCDYPLPHSLSRDKKDDGNKGNHAECVIDKNIEHNDIPVAIKECKCSGEDLSAKNNYSESFSHCTQDSSNNNNSETSVPCRSPDSCNSEVMFERLCVEDNALLALDKDGIIYSGNVPVPVGRQRITDVALGKEHCMALTDGGVVLTWGSGMRGQLGNGEMCHIDGPSPVESLQGLTITSISCGGWHSVALSDTGDVYVWGWNESGQLGFPSKTQNENSVLGAFEHHCQCPTPLQYGLTSNVNMKDKMEIAPSSSSATLRLGNEKKFPDTAKQPKIDKRINRDRIKEIVNVQASPKLLDFWSENTNIIEVVCGDRHTLFRLDDGSVWSVGMNKYGQLGLGHTNSQCEPAEVPIKNIAQVYAGGWNSVFITND